MLVSDIIDEVKEAIGKCNDAFAIRTMTRAVQLLANKGLIDPLIGYFDFSVSDDYFVALPRAVKTPLRVNINSKPTFSRSRIYEFHINSLGTQDAEEPGLSWSDRGYAPIQNAKSLPGKMSYVVSAADVGKKITLTGLDSAGRTQTETLVGGEASPVPGNIEFHVINLVLREATTHEAFLWCNLGAVATPHVHEDTNLTAQYYADETNPEYRIIKLSKAASNVRVMFRRHVFALKTLEDFIPMHSELAVVQACKAVRFMATDEMDKSAAALALAEMLLKEEQTSREEHNAIASNQEQQPAIDVGIFCRDSIVAGDVYDTTASIFGDIGREGIFDKITTAIEILSNRGKWDARLGWVDVFSADNTQEITYHTPQNGVGNGHGYFVLPRHVEHPLAISFKCGNLMPRNRWFEFHLNGDGGMQDRASHGTWDDAGEVCINRLWPLNPADPPKARRALPLTFVAVPDDPSDEDTSVRLFGFERDAYGYDIEVWRGGERGWECPCVIGAHTPSADAPRFVSIDRILKGKSRSFIRLYAVNYTIIDPGSPEIPAVPAVPPTPEIPEVPPTPAIPEILESDIRTLTGNPGITGALSIDFLVYEEPAPQSVTGWFYLRQGNPDGIQQLEMYSARSDEGALITSVASEAVNDAISLGTDDFSSAPWGTVTAFGLTLSGFSALTGPYSGQDVNSEFKLERIYTPYSAYQPATPGSPYVPATPGSPEIPAVPAVPPTYGYSIFGQFGFWYPDELEPKYRMIKLSHSTQKRIRIAFRKRTMKVTSLMDVIPLRSRFAIEQQLRAIKAGETDPAAAAAFEATALGYLRDEHKNLGPTAVAMFQFDESTMPGFTGNVQ